MTAFGGGSTYRKAASFGSSGADEVVDVLCFDSAGNAVDNELPLVYADDQSILANDRDNGYVLANDADPTLGAAYTPAASERRNSDGGTVHVTATHTTSERCEVTDWSSTAVVSAAPPTSSPTSPATPRRASRPMRSSSSQRRCNPEQP